MTLEKPSNLEKIAGNTLTQSAATAVVTLASTLTAAPVAALSIIPGLIGTLAHTRLSKRIETALAEVARNLEKNRDIVNKISDERCQLLLGITSTIYITCSEEKLIYLKKAAISSLTINEIDEHSAYLLSRVIRDISGEEIKFLEDSRKKDFIALLMPDSAISPSENHLIARINEKSGYIVSGLISLGLLVKWPENGDVDFYKHTHLSSILLNLIHETD